jgi:diacylglycerol kinase (ATP)
MSKIVLLFNPAAGTKEKVTPAMLREKGFEGEIVIAKAPGDVFELAKRFASDAEVVAVYGGDGTVMEAARALCKTETSLAIVPGGTANVMAKELNIPLPLDKSLELLRSGHQIRRIDMGMVNGDPFLIRLNIGLFADMVSEADAGLKEKWGQWAYGLAAFQTLGREAIDFHLTLDGRSIIDKAVALTVTNAGNVGKSGYSFLPDIAVDDGWLDVIALDNTDIVSLLKLGGSILLQKDTHVLRHWRAKEIVIRFDPDNLWLCDDAERSGNQLKIEIMPSALQILVPSQDAN